MWERVQFLRLARRNLSLCGVQLYSCTAKSRLNDFFPYIPVDEAIRRIEQHAGRLDSEETKGRYETVIPSMDLPYHKDVQPLAWDQTVQKRGLQIEAEKAEAHQDRNHPAAANENPSPEKIDVRKSIAEKLQELDGIKQNAIREE
jgi:hypothetical protein